MGYISPILEKEITKKYNFIINNNEYILDSLCAKKEMKSIQKDSQFQSFKIENRDMDIPYSIPRNPKRKEIKKGKENMKLAYSWGKNNFNPYTFNEDFIKKVSARIAPNFYENKIATYRDCSVHILGSNHMPPTPYKVETREMPEYANHIRESLKKIPPYHEKKFNVIDPIILSTYTHFNLVRIHPFVDGNGRTARMLQNIILGYYNIPVPIIKSGERNSYYDLLETAWDGFIENQANGINDKISKKEKYFFEYNAEKINSSLDSIIEKCTHNFF